MGIVSLPLVLWDIHNARVIESMGMAWDMGAPIWPYQASDILLRLLNGPAYSIAMPITNLLRLGAPAHLVLVVPAYLIWWWLLEKALHLESWFWHAGRSLACLLSLSPCCCGQQWLFAAFFGSGLDYRTFDLSTALLILRFLTPAVWFIALTSLFLARVKRAALAN